MSDIIKMRQWSDEPEDDYWPPPPNYVESVVSGQLRTRILELAGLADVGQLVTLIEIEIEGGYSEYTIEMDYGIDVLVDGQKVWSDDTHFSDEQAMAAFLQWVAP